MLSRSDKITDLLFKHLFQHLEIFTTYSYINSVLLVSAGGHRRKGVNNTFNENVGEI